MITATIKMRAAFLLRHQRAAPHESRHPDAVIAVGDHRSRDMSTMGVDAEHVVICKAVAVFLRRAVSDIANKIPPQKIIFLAVIIIVGTIEIIGIARIIVPVPRAAVAIDILPRIDPENRPQIVMIVINTGINTGAYNP